MDNQTPQSILESVLLDTSSLQIKKELIERNTKPCASTSNEEPFSSDCETSCDSDIIEISEVTINDKEKASMVISRKRLRILQQEPILIDDEDSTDNNNEVVKKSMRTRNHTQIQENDLLSDNATMTNSGKSPKNKHKIPNISVSYGIKISNKLPESLPKNPDVKFNVLSDKPTYFEANGVQVKIENQQQTSTSNPPNKKDISHLIDNSGALDLSKHKGAKGSTDKSTKLLKTNLTKSVTQTDTIGTQDDISTVIDKIQEKTAKRPQNCRRKVRSKPRKRNPRVNKKSSAKNVTQAKNETDSNQTDSEVTDKNELSKLRQSRKSERIASKETETVLRDKSDAKDLITQNVQNSDTQSENASPSRKRRRIPAKELITQVNIKKEPLPKKPDAQLIDSDILEITDLKNNDLIMITGLKHEKQRQSKQNVNERSRLTNLQLTEAFEELRQILPVTGPNNKQLSKLAAIKASINYIGFLHNELATCYILAESGQKNREQSPTLMEDTVKESNENNVEPSGDTAKPTEATLRLENSSEISIMTDINDTPYKPDVNCSVIVEHSPETTSISNPTNSDIASENITTQDLDVVEIEEDTQTPDEVVVATPLPTMQLPFSHITGIQPGQHPPHYLLGLNKN